MSNVAMAPVSERREADAPSREQGHAPGTCRAALEQAARWLDDWSVRSFNQDAFSWSDRMQILGQLKTRADQIERLHRHYRPVTSAGG